MADEDILIEIGDVIFPGAVKRWPTENGIRIWVNRGPRGANDPGAREAARAIFQTLLGILRSWRANAGELRDETRSGLGAGTARDEAGNQWLAVGPAIEYIVTDGEIANLAVHAQRGLDASSHLRNALWLNGRANRTAADYYMIHEYALMEFKSPKGIREILGISVNAQERLTASANNLSPLHGGRHAGRVVTAPLSLGAQGAFAAGLLRQWIDTYE